MHIQDAVHPPIGTEGQPSDPGPLGLEDGLHPGYACGENGHSVLTSEYTRE